MSAIADPSGRTRVGDARPSQMLYVYGVGAQIDLPNFSVVVAGLEAWAPPREEIKEARLLRAVRRELGDQVERLVAYPWLPGEVKPMSEASRAGVPVVPFPRWMRCPLCNALATIDSGTFVFKPETYRPERSRFIHEQCGGRVKKPKQPPVAVPARFVIACSRGHLDEFPWMAFVHAFAPCANVAEGAALIMYDRGSGTRSTDVVVECKKCDAKRTVGSVFGPNRIAPGTFAACRGRRPELRTFEPGCPELPEPMLLGASNLWFSITRSAFALPIEASDEIVTLVAARWQRLEDVTSSDLLRFAVKNIPELDALRDFATDAVLDAIAAHRAASNDADEADDANEDLRRPEWERFSDPAESPVNDEFDIESVGVPRSFTARLSDVVAARRLREVVASIAFARIDVPDAEHVDDGTDPSRISLTAHAPRWVPAIDVRGEGVFVRFDESRVAAWAAAAETTDHIAALRASHYRQCLPHRPRPWPGARYLLLHSFAHLLINEVALDCGYSAASVRERIYSHDGDGDASPMAGVLLYTASPDAEGTLGGLVSLAEPTRLGQILTGAFERAMLCGSDPLCADHVPESDETTLHGAACHACLLLPETSCERFNRYLDRTVLVETLARVGLGFFE